MTWAPIEKILTAPSEAKVRALCTKELPGAINVQVFPVEQPVAVEHAGSSETVPPNTVPVLEENPPSGPSEQEGSGE